MSPRPECPKGKHKWILDRSVPRIICKKCLTRRPTTGLDDPRFNAGVDPQGVVAYEPSKDDVRLRGQLLRVASVMIDKRWRTLNEISNITGDPHASISAQLRHLRKKRFGSHVVVKRSRGEREDGLWEYRLFWNDDVPVPLEEDDE